MNEDNVNAAETTEGQQCNRVLSEDGVCIKLPVKEEFDDQDFLQDEGGPREEIEFIKTEPVDREYFDECNENYEADYDEFDSRQEEESSSDRPFPLGSPQGQPDGGARRIGRGGGEERRRFSCALCPYSSAHKNKLRRHVGGVHTGERPHSCPLCDYTTAYRSYLKVHARRHELACRECGFKAEAGCSPPPLLLCRHLKERPLEASSSGGRRRNGSPPRYACPDCGYTTTHRSTFRKHERKHSGERPFACHLCPFSSATNSNLISHLKIHTGLKPYSCPHCQYSTAFKYLLVKHNRTHTGERPFSCTLCDYSAAHRSNLVSHMRRHTGDRRFACSLCNYSAIEKYELATHMRRHTGEKPFACGECDFSTHTVRSFRRHRKKAHIKD